MPPMIMQTASPRQVAKVIASLLGSELPLGNLA